MSRQATFTEYITEEILLEIFYRLPAKSLGKCMCVSKAWNFLIKDPFFVSSHAIHQSKLRCWNNNNDKNLFFVMTGRHQVEYSLHLDDLEFSPEPMPRVLGFMKNGDLMLSAYDNLQLVSCDPERSELGYFGIQGTRTYVSSFTESLVLLDQVNGDGMTENGAKYASNASHLIERAADGFTELAANGEATNDSSDIEESRSNELKREGLQLRTGK
ncbi:hypothetical protein V6N13_136725 [Hibiscus sabdariffa]